jgi:hypothetical protein
MDDICTIKRDLPSRAIPGSIGMRKFPQWCLIMKLSERYYILYTVSVEGTGDEN